MKPVPYLDCAQELALPVGHAHFCGLFRRFLSRVSGAERRQLRAFFSKELEHKLRLGTACSGTDGLILALKGFNQVMEVDMQCKVETNQTFASEKHSAKQLFLKTSFPELPRLFGDSCQLADGKAYDAITGVEQEVPCDLDIFCAGFPCVDASALNASASNSENRACLVTGSLRTGSVFWSLRRFLRKRRKRFLFAVLENVPGLLIAPTDTQGRVCGPSNADTACFLLEMDGFFVIVWLLCPRLFGIPQSRPRLYFLALEKARLAALGMTDASAMDFLCKTMDRLVGSQLQPISDYILPPSHSVLQRYVAQCAAAQGSSDPHEVMQSTWGIIANPIKQQHKEARGRTPRWPRQHMEVFAQHGLDWCTHFGPSNECKQQHPGLAAISDREFEALRLAGVTCFPEPRLRLVEASQTIGRHPCSGDGYTGAVFPGARRYITSQCRLLLGIEEMHLQSLWFPDQVLSQFDNNLLCNLAGNAFEVSCCAAVVFAGLLILVSGVQASEPLPLALTAASQNEDGDNDEDVDGLRAVWRSSRHRSISTLAEDDEDCYLLKSARLG